MSSKTKKPCHFGLILKYGYLLYGLLLTAILSTCAFLASEFGVLGYIRSVKGLDLYVYIFSGVFIFAILLYYIYRAKTKCVSFADAFNIAGIFTPLLIASYVYFMLGYTKSVVYIVLGSILLINLIFLPIFVARRDERNEKRDIIFTENSFLGYFINVFRKYRFLGIVTIAFLTVAVTYLFFNPDFSSVIFETISAYPLMRYLILVCATLFVAYMAIDSARRRVCVADAILISSLISMPITLAQIIFVNGSNDTQFIIWAVIVGVMLICTLIRYLSFNVTINFALEDGKKKCYLGKFFKKYNPLLILLVACVIANILVFGYLSEVYLKAIVVTDGVLTAIAPDFFPMACLTISAGLSIVIGFILSIFSIAKKGVSCIDFIIALNLILGIAATVGIMFMPDLIYMIVSISFTAINFILFITRICIVKKQKTLC